MVGGGNFQPFFYLLITKIQEKWKKLKSKQSQLQCMVKK